MKLPWDKKYLIIAFHIIITIIVIYFLKYCIDFLAYILSNLKTIFNNIATGIGWIISIFYTVIIAFIIAYLLDPVVEFFQNRYNSIKEKYKNKIKIYIKFKDKQQDNLTRARTAGTIITYLIIISIISMFIYVIINKIIVSDNRVGTLEDIANSMKMAISRFSNDFSNIYTKIENYLIDNGIFEYIFPYINNFSNAITGFINQIGNRIIEIISAIVNRFLNIIISFVIAFYFLKDKEAIKLKFANIGNTFINRRIYKFIRNSLEDIHIVFSGYIRGTILDAFIMSVLIGIGLSLINVRFAILIGIISGFSNIIPYFGALVGILLAVFVSLINGHSMQAIYSIIIMIALQQLDSIFIAPRIIGERVKLSPILVIIALSVFGQLFGLWGMIFAVPIFAIIKLFAKRIYERQKIKKETDILRKVI